MRTDSLGDAGHFLRAYLFGDEFFVIENREETLDTLNFWMEVKC